MGRKEGTLMLKTSETIREASGRKTQIWKGIIDWESRREKGLDDVINCHRAQEGHSKSKGSYFACFHTIHSSHVMQKFT